MGPHGGPVAKWVGLQAPQRCRPPEHRVRRTVRLRPRATEGALYGGEAPCLARRTRSQPRAMLSAVVSIEATQWAQWGARRDSPAAGRHTREVNTPLALRRRERSVIDLETAAFIGVRLRHVGA